MIRDDTADRIVEAKANTARLTAARNSTILHVLLFLGPREIGSDFAERRLHLR